MTARTEWGRLSPAMWSADGPIQLLRPPVEPLPGSGPVFFYDPSNGAPPRNAIVLGVGLKNPGSVARAIKKVNRQNASAIVLRHSATTDLAVAAVIDESQVAVFALRDECGWLELADSLRRAVDEPSEFAQIVDPRLADVVGSEDLFNLANAITTILDAPVTIEDRHSRILAFSDRQEQADRARIETILRRQAPENVTKTYVNEGVLSEIYRAERPVWIDPGAVGLDQLPRVAVAVRAGHEVLGSIWAIVREPLTEDRAEAFVEAAKVVALRLLRMRAVSDLTRDLRAVLVNTALDGGEGGRAAVQQLGLGMRPIVLALDLLGAGADGGQESGDVALVTERRRLSEAFALHLASADPRAACALIGNVTYGLMPTDRGSGSPESRAKRVANEFLERTGGRAPSVIGIGGVASEDGDLADARAEAERALRVLRLRGAPCQAAALEDVQFDAILLDLMDLTTARAEPVSRPVHRLAKYDAQHKSSLVFTLQVWLECFGDISIASARLGVHRNSLRYRIRRIEEIAGFDLKDSDARLAAILQLRLFAIAEASRGVARSAN